jgi:phage protein D
MMGAVNLRQPRWLLLYQNRNITAAIEPWVTKVTYADKMHGEADELEIDLDDTDGRWRTIWAPAKKDKLGLKFGYLKEPMQNAGGFEIDEIEYKGPPHSLTIKALAAGITPSLRTAKSAAYEGQSLRQIAETVAARHGLTVSGDIADLRLGRLTQDKERDLSFLKRTAEDFGHVFTIRDQTLVFHQIADLKSRPAIATIDRTMMLQYALKSSTLGKVASVALTYHDPDTRQIVSASAVAADPITGDVLRMRDRSPTRETAEARAQAALERANRGGEGEGSITLPGDPRLAAGCRVQVTGLGILNKDYLVEKATHAMERQAGYVTTLEVKAG